VLVDGSAPAARTQLPETLGALSIVSHVKIAGMLGPTAAHTLLDRAVTLVRAVPVYQLRVPRDLAVLPATAATIAGWHAGGRPGVPGAPG
jgi:hypothetical protein